MPSLICCDGPFNGGYYDVGPDPDLKDGDQFVVYRSGSHGIYEVATWPTDERVLIHAATKDDVELLAEADAFSELLRETFPVSTMIREAVADAEVR